MERLRLSAKRLQEMVKAATQYGIEKGVPLYKVYVLVDTGINAGNYVFSDEEWDERERLGQSHPKKSESFPHGGGRLGRSAELAEQSGFYPAGKPLDTSTRPGESPADYWKRHGL